MSTASDGAAPKGVAPERVASTVVASPSYVGRLLRDAAVRPSRRLGQNFLVDRGVLARVVSLIDPTGAEVLEIGAGLGALTLALAEAGARRVVAVEKDRRLADILVRNTAGWPQVQVVVGDALELDWRHLAGAAAAAGECVVAGNLPYAVTTPLLLKLVEPPLFWSRAVVMVQLEVADRILGRPGTKDYGALTLAVQAVASARLALEVGRRCFLPAPGVTTAVLHLERRPRPVGGLDPAGLARLAAVVRASFGQRRKTLANALAAGLGRPRPEVALRLAAAGIDPGRRGETLTLEEFLVVEEALRVEEEPRAGGGDPGGDRPGRPTEAAGGPEG